MAFPALDAPSVVAAAAISIADGELHALLRRDGAEESRRFANHPGGYDAWDEWLSSRGVERVRVWVTAADPSAGELATYLSETGHEVRLVDDDADDPRRILALAARGEGEPFVPAERYVAPERYARVSWR